jgi:hypothetical protein
MKWLVITPLVVVGWLLGLWLHDYTRRHGHP